MPKLRRVDLDDTDIEILREAYRATQAGGTFAPWRGTKTRCERLAAIPHFPRLKEAGQSVMSGIVYVITEHGEKSLRDRKLLP